MIEILVLLALANGGRGDTRAALAPLELMVSLNTMRTHTKNMYAKLRVNTRRRDARHHP